MVIVYTGKDNHVSWEFNRKTRVLTLQGNGPIPDFDPFHGKFPKWMNLQSQVCEIHIGEGITRIGDYAFYPYDHGQYIALQSRIHRVIFPFTLESIGRCAFRANTHLHFIDLSGCSRLLSIEPLAFASCFKARGVDLSGCLRLNEISDRAFCGCDELAYINLQGCVSLNDCASQRLRKETPPHIPIVMPNGEVSCCEQSPPGIQKELRVLLGSALIHDLTRD